MLERDTVTGLNLAVYREESPATGRWDSQDPTGFSASDGNLYRYVQDDAVNGSDVYRAMGLSSPRGMTPEHDQPGDGPPAPPSRSPAMVLPDGPGGLPPEWTPDPSHRDPFGRRFRHPNGDYLDWSPGRPGKPGFRGKKHWHYNGGGRHLRPGDSIPDPGPPPAPAPPSSAPRVTVCVVAGAGGLYVAYRFVRSLPSFAPPLWWTLPWNLGLP